MALIDSPWSRLRKPPTIPTGFTAQALNDLDDLAFAELIQAQLVPRDQDVQGRRLWDRFWKVLREDDQLADRTYNVLEQFLDTTEDALDLFGAQYRKMMDDNLQRMLADFKPPPG